MSDEEKRWPFDGFYLKLAEAQREYEQEQHIDPASLTEEERQQKLQEILDCINASRKKKKEADEQLDPIVPEEEPETAGATPQPAKQYITDYPKERLEGEVEKIQKYQLGPVEAYRKWFDDRKAWKAYLHQPETVEILKKSHTVVLDPREGEYCWRKRATLQARIERVFLLQMLEQEYQTELLKKIDESLLAKVERLEPPPLLEYLDDHLNEERYYQDWQKIFFELGHIYNKADGHAEKSLPSYTFARQWLQQYGYDLQKKRATSGELRNKNVWWVTKQ